MASVKSKVLFGYVAKSYATRFAGLVFGICIILQMLDLMANSDEIMAGTGASYMSTVRYIGLRFPEILSQFIPFTALLAAIMTLAGLNTASEIVIMKSAGMSAYRVLTPMIMVSVIIALAHFAFNESVKVKTSAALNHWQANGYATDIPPPPASSKEVWVMEDNTIIRVQQITRNGKILVLDDITQFERDPQGRLAFIAKGDFAVFQNNQWTMFDVRRFDLNRHETTTEASTPWPVNIEPERFLALSVKPAHVSIIELYRAVQRLIPTGQPANAMISALYRKIAEPAASIIMPLLAALAGFGVQRSGMLFIRILSGMALGFGYFVFDNMIAAMGEFGKLPPLLASCSAFIMFCLIGATILLYTEE